MLSAGVFTVTRLTRSRVAQKKIERHYSEPVVFCVRISIHFCLLWSRGETFFVVIERSVTVKRCCLRNLFEPHVFGLNITVLPSSNHPRMPDLESLWRELIDCNRSQEVAAVLVIFLTCWLAIGRWTVFFLC